MARKVLIPGRYSGTLMAFRVEVVTDVLNTMCRAHTSPVLIKCRSEETASLVYRDLLTLSRILGRKIPESNLVRTENDFAMAQFLCKNCLRYFSCRKTEGANTFVRCDKRARDSGVGF